MGREELLKLLPLPGLPTHIEQVADAMKKTIAGSEFEKSINLLLERDGKRLRPMLLIASAALSGKRVTKDIILGAAAVELIHEASLVHDDIIDGDSQLELGHALLMGDYLIAAGLGLGGALGSSTVDILAGAIKSMAEGQAQQLSRRYRADTSDEFYIKTAKNKAGALFAAACQLGAAGSPAQPALRKYGEDFGVAFQIIDDMVDLDFGPAQEPAARLAAQKYSSSAQKRLLRLPDSPLKWGLAELPGLLLEVSLA